MCILPLRDSAGLVSQRLHRASPIVRHASERSAHLYQYIFDCASHYNTVKILGKMLDSLQSFRRA